MWHRLRSGAPQVSEPLLVDAPETHAWDSVTDVAFGFRIEDSGILCDDTEVTLTGETYAGQPFVGTDDITTVECTSSSCHP